MYFTSEGSSSEINASKTQPYPRFEVFYRKDLFESLGDIQETYQELAAVLKERLPALTPEDLFFEKDEEALRMEMERTANTNCPGAPVFGRGSSLRSDVTSQISKFPNAHQ